MLGFQGINLIKVIYLGYYITRHRSTKNLMYVQIFIYIYVTKKYVFTLFFKSLNFGTLLITLQYERNIIIKETRVRYENKVDYANE